MTDKEATALKIVSEMSWYIYLNAEQLGWLESGLTLEQLARAVHVGAKQGLERLKNGNSD